MLGGLYLAYDLLGGQHRPQDLDPRVTYGLLFGVGYGLALGPYSGSRAATRAVLTLAWEYSRASQIRHNPGIWNDIAASGIRGLGFAIGMAYLFGPIFTVSAFPFLSSRIRTSCCPSASVSGRHSTTSRPRGPDSRKRQFWAAVNRIFRLRLSPATSAPRLLINASTPLRSA